MKAGDHREYARQRRAEKEAEARALREDMSDPEDDPEMTGEPETDFEEGEPDIDPEEGETEFENEPEGETEFEDEEPEEESASRSVMQREDGPRVVRGCALTRNGAVDLVELAARPRLTIAPWR